MGNKNVSLTFSLRFIKLCLFYPSPRPPSDNVITIGGDARVETECNTGRVVSEGRRRREVKPPAEDNTLKGINGPLNSGGIYSAFVRVYSPSGSQTEVLFFLDTILFVCVKRRRNFRDATTRNDIKREFYFIHRTYNMDLFRIHFLLYYEWQIQKGRNRRLHPPPPPPQV